MADWLLSREDVDEVWLLPTADHPLGKTLAPHSVRAEWCEALAKTVSPRCRVCRIENELPVPSYTIDTLRELQSRHPDAHFRWVMGVDLMSQVDQWKDWASIERDFEPIVVGRSGYGDAQGAPTFARVSSTEIRRTLSEGRHDARLPAEVAQAVGGWFAPVPLLRHASLDRYPRVCHGFSGAMDTSNRGLDLGFPSPLPSPVYRQNWVRTLAALSGHARPSHVAMLEQVHGGDVVVCPKPEGVERFVGAADGLVTTDLDVVLTIRTADCVPVLFASPQGVAAAHAGWRGVAADVCRRTVSALCAATGEDPSEVRAVIGPHISGAVYEVGEEVVRGIEATGVPQSTFVRRVDDRVWVDLRAAVEAQLNMSGLGAVCHVDGCTWSDTRWHSFRRDAQRAGRQVAMIARFST